MLDPVPEIATVAYRISIAVADTEPTPLKV
jgi:hypothetical protein